MLVKILGFHKITCFGENGDFAVKGPPETAPGLTFSKGFPPRREGDSVFMKTQKSCKTLQKQKESHEIMKMSGNRENHKNHAFL